MSDFLDRLRPEAVYFKLTSKSKFGDAVSVNDVIQVLKITLRSHYDNTMSKLLDLVPN